MNSSALILLVAALPVAAQNLALPDRESTLDDGQVPLSLTEFDPFVPTLGPLTPTIADEQALVDLYLKLEDYDAAGKAADRILRKFPNDPVALGAKTSIALKEQDVIASLRWAKRFRAAQPGPDADLALAGSYRLARRFDEALEILEDLRKRTPAGEPFPHLIEFGYTYYDSRQYDRARTVFQTVRNDLRYPPQTREAATKQVANLNRERKIAAAYRAIELRDLDEARAIADDLNEVAKREKAEKPDPNLVALNAILDAEQHAYVDAALATFEELKKDTPEGKRFQFNSAYATQLLDKRRYPAAVAALKQANPELNHYFTPEEVAQHREAMFFMKKFANPVIETAVRLQDYSEGRAVRSSLIASKPLNQALTRIGLDYTYTHLDPEVPTPGDAADHYHQAYLTARHQFSDRIHGSAAIGVSNDHLAYRAAVGWSRPSQDQFFELTLSGGHQPVDTLRLEALGAREDRLAFAFSTELPACRRLRLKGNAFVRQIELDHKAVGDLGSGWGGRLELEYLLYKRDRDVATISAYLGLEKFNFDSSGTDVALLGFDPRDLVEDEYQALGITLYGERALTDNLSVHALAGVEYRIDSGEPVYSIGGGLKYWLNEDAILRADALYSTGGKAANRDAGYFEGTVGVDLTL